MGNSGRLRGTVLLLAAVFPLVLHAQMFQKPTEAELKMTSDPKAPGAAAVYLNYIERDNDPLHTMTIYASIKVLTAKGKQLATVDLPYLTRGYKIVAIKGRTIHPDGTIIKLSAKPQTLMSSKSGHNGISRTVFTLPSVQVGSILQYRYSILYDDNQFSSPFWHIQRKYFVHQAHYSFTPFQQFMPRTGSVHSNEYLEDSKGRVINTLLWWYKLPKGVEVKTTMRSYTVDVKDIPPIPDEAWMPPLQSVLYRVFFYYESTSNAQQFWIRAAKDWSKQVDKFASQSRTLKRAVAGIVSPKDSELVKAQKLYRAVQALNNTDYSRAKSASEMKQLKLRPIRNATDVWKQKGGNSNEIALLYLSMARAAGLTAFAVSVVDRDEGVFDPGYMSMDQLDSTIVLVGVNGKGILVDPGEEMCPFGRLSWTHADTGGLRQSPKGPGYAKIPSQPYTANSLTRQANITLAGNGSMTGTFTFVMKGQDALRWRQAALENSMTDLKKHFDRWLQTMTPQGVEAHVDHFVGLKNPQSNLVAIINAKGSLGTSTSQGMMLVPGLFFASRGREPFVKEAKRLEPIDMRYADETMDSVVYHLPAGYTVEGAPQSAQDLWTGHADYIVKTQKKPGQITVERTLARAFDMLKADQYQELRGFYQKVASADQSELVLTKASTTRKGN